MPTGNERTEVKTYVPAYQKAEWKEHADELEMSQSEFVRSMVQAGRKAIERDVEKGDHNGSSPRGDGLESRILDVLGDGPQSFEEIVDAVTEELEAELDDALHRLQTEGEIAYSGRRGGYVLNGE